jgi:hypothetical protein
MKLGGSRPISRSCQSQLTRVGMKNLVHCFSRQAVSTFLQTLAKDKSSRNVEFIVALFMQRVYEKQWNAPTTIGFYLTKKWAELLSRTDIPSTDLLLQLQALKDGIDENGPIDFVIAADGVYQEFQLKRFGMKGASTEALIDYLNGIKKKYPRTDAACLVAITDIDLIDFPRVARETEKDNFPFTELLLVGVSGDDKFYVVGILREEGWSAYDLKAVVSG